jgi:RNA polymerase sigma-70 factor (ECF subfamily)
MGLLYMEHNSWLKGWLYGRLGCTSQAADLARTPSCAWMIRIS